ncbi:MAG: hypothetical protein OEW75_11100, partial [Cyclobacteriaceae bacterium]|nr:hypothetical protein [Cyclobacteriaceae bacterium]
DVPYIPFNDIVLNLTLPEYQNLQFDGGHTTLVDGGVKGIILYRENSTTYHAFEKNCTWDSNSACSTVEVDVSQLYMMDPCCNSTFSFPLGDPTGGPALYPLRRYLVYLNGYTLTITDQIAY